MAKLKKKKLVSSALPRSSNNGDAPSAASPKGATPAALADLQIPQVPRQELFREISSNFWRFGFNQERLLNPDELVGRKGMRIYRQMLADDQVKAALFLKKHAILSTGWDVRPASDSDQDIEVAEFVKSCFIMMDGSLDDDLMEILSSLEFGFCLHGDTIIHSPEGDRPIKDWVGRQPWVYARENGELRLAKASKVWKAQSNVPCVKVCYEWFAHGQRKSSEIICTDTHPFQMLDGVYIKAGELKPGDRLAPFSQKTGHPGYGKPRASVKMDDRFDSWQKRSRWVWEQMNGPIPNGMHIHHVDGDTLNDAPDNLEPLPSRGKASHASFHTRRWLRDATDDQLSHRQAALRAFNATEVRLKSAVASRAANLRNWKDPIDRAKRIAGRSGQKRTPEQLERIRAAARDPEKRRTLSENKKASWAARQEQERNHRVKSVEPWGIADVYDMTVPGYHNFAANNVFVHNSVTELCFRPVISGPFKGKIGLRALKTRKPDDFAFLVDAHDNLLENGIEQFGQKMPTWKFAIMSASKCFDNWYGTSDLRAAYKNFWLKDFVMKAWGIFLDRYSVPLALGTFPAGGLDGQISAFRSALEHLQLATTMTMPSDYKIDFPEVSAQGSSVFALTIDRQDAAIARAILVPNMLGMSPQGEHGGYSQARKHFDVFILVIEKLQRDLAETVVGEQIIRRLVDLNYRVEKYPAFFLLPFTETDKSQLMTLFFQAVMAGTATARPEDEVHIRMVTEFPEVSLDELRAATDAAKAQQQSGLSGDQLSGKTPPVVPSSSAGNLPKTLSDGELNSLIDEMLHKEKANA